MWPYATHVQPNPSGRCEAMTPGRCCCRWDLPSFGKIRVVSGVTEGYYLTGHDDERDWSSVYLRAEDDEKLSAVFDFQYRTDLDAYLIMGVSFDFGPGTNEAWGSSECVTAPSTLSPVLQCTCGLTSAGEATCMARSACECFGPRMWECTNSSAPVHDGHAVRDGHVVRGGHAVHGRPCCANARRCRRRATLPARM